MQADFLNLVKTELFLLRKRPSTWIILGLWLTVTAIFAYIFEYVSYRSGSNEFNDTFDTLLPAALAQTISEGIPFYGGSLVLILGVMSIGSEFGWGTWKTMFTQRPGRSAIFGAKMTALGIILVPFVLGAFALGAVASSIIATVEDRAITWPDAQLLLESMLSGWLILAVWAAMGVLLATVTRGTSLAIGVGILWGLAFEGLLTLFASNLSWLEWLADVMLRANGYSLVRAVVGGVSEGAATDGPGAFNGPFVSGAQALIVLVAYLVAFLGGSLWLLRRRDVA